MYVSLWGTKDLGDFQPRRECHKHLLIPLCILRIWKQQFGVKTPDITGQIKDDIILHLVGILSISLFANHINVSYKGNKE